MEQSLNRQNVAIVLVETSYPGNIGSVARAMTNMGFEDLRLVNPLTDHRGEDARKLAHGCHDFLERAHVYPTLEAAVQGCSLVVATSHKSIRYNQKSFTARELGRELIPYCEENKVALVFGREQSGLTNTEINFCSWLVSIPSASSYPSLNLSQAVMLLCYELFMTSLAVPDPKIAKLAESKELEHFLGYVHRTLELAGFHHKNNRPEIFLGTLRRVLTRRKLEVNDLNVFYKLFQQIETLAQNLKSEDPAKEL